MESLTDATASLAGLRLARNGKTPSRRSLYFFNGLLREAEVGGGVNCLAVMTAACGGPHADHKRLSFIMDANIRAYLSEIGRRGGQTSRRTLDRETARRMVAVREAPRAYRRFHASCFWSHPPDLDIGINDVAWVANQLMRHGGREAWMVGKSLCP